MSRIDVRLIITGYLIVQALGATVWWCVLFVEPESVKWFQPASWSKHVLFSFLLPDLCLLIAGSLITAHAVVRRRPWSSLAIWSIAMASLYPTLFCIAASLQTGEAWIASALMSTMAGLMLAMATIHGTNQQIPAAIRVTEMTPSVALSWTLLQIFVFWSIFLWVLPMGINELLVRVGWRSFAHSWQIEIAMTLLIMASFGGLWSGWTIASRGNGTPLPTATASDLVVAGPYRFVRNPMALTGVLQGVAVGWLFGSIPLIAGALLCGMVWHILIRPVEESDLHARFGASYALYQQSVGLWLPSFR